MFATRATLQSRVTAPPPRARPVYCIPESTLARGKPLGPRALGPVCVSVCVSESLSLSVCVCVCVVSCVVHVFSSVYRLPLWYSGTGDMPRCGVVHAWVGQIVTFFATAPLAATWAP